MIRQQEDEALVLEAREAPDGDSRAFEELVRRHQGHVVTNCRYLTRSGHEGEELAQEVFLKAFFGLKRFEGRASFRTWIQRIKVNHCLNHIKRRKEVSVSIDEAGNENADELRVAPKAERNLEARDEAERIERTLEALNDTLRLPLIMRDMDHLSYQEIADQLGLGLSAVKMRIKRAREEFRRVYENPTESSSVESNS